MANNMSDYLEEQLLTHIFRTNTFSKPTTIAIALSTSNSLNDTVTGANMSEVADSNGYARVDIGAPDNGDWDVVVNGTTTNTNPITIYPGVRGGMGNNRIRCYYK